MSESGQRIAVFGAGYVGLVTGACFAELGHRVAVRDILPDRIDALRAARCRSTSPASSELLERNAERLAFTTDVAEAIDGRGRSSYVAVGTPPTYSGDADLSAVWTVIDELPDVERRIVVVMKSTVPVGTGAKVRHRLDARGLGHVGYVSNPEFTAEGTAVTDFLEPDRIVIGAFDEADGGRDRRAARRDRGADRPGGRRVRRDDQAGRERSADDPDLVHQRDRERLRGDRCRRRQGRRGHRPRPPDRQELPPGGNRLRRLVLPEGLAWRSSSSRRTPATTSRC